MSFLTDLQKSIVQRQTDLGKLYAYIIIYAVGVETASHTGHCPINLVNVR